MADTKWSALSQFLNFGLTDQVVGLRSGAGVRWPVSALAQLVGYSCQGRLTCTSGTPVTTTDLTAQATIYFTPYNGNLLALYTASNWKLYTFTELTLALSGLTSGKNYDVFVYDNSGTLTIELSSAWTNDTTRANAIAQQDGIDVKSSDHSRRLVGTIRSTGTTTTEDSAAKRFVWNKYNRVERSLINATETTDSWTYTTAAYRQANANAANQLAYVTGDATVTVKARILGLAGNSTGGIACSIGIGVNSTTVNSGQVHGQNALTTVTTFIAEYVGQPGLGYNFLAWLEFSNATGTTTWYGDAGSATIFQTGMTGSIWN